MPASDSPAFLVARFLKTNGYEETLDAFIAEANLPPDAGALTSKDALTLEGILEEKRAFDQSLKYSKQGGADAGIDTGWVSPAPSKPSVVTSLPSSANLLYVGVQDGVMVGGALRSCLVASAADRTVSLLDTSSTADQLSFVDHLPPVDSPVLSCAFLDSGSRIVVTAMSGLVRLYNFRTQRSSERRDHKKYVVKAAVWKGEDSTWLATAGWDARVLLYRISEDELGEPVAEITLLTNPESMVFAKDPDTDRVFLIVSRRDSSSLYYHLLNTERLQAQDAISTPSNILISAGSQNLAPHSNAWVAFSPSSMELSPTDPTLLAVATSSLPHMKAIIVRLLFPSPESIASPPVYTTQSEQGHASLAKQNREEAAIQVHISTMAPQTPYSTPQVCWRPNGSGIFVNGDDGAIRGIEAKTGKIVSILKDGHEIGSKIRSLWAGFINEDRQEWLVSGGFDRRLVVWRQNSEE